MPYKSKKLMSVQNDQTNKQIIRQTLQSHFTNSNNLTVFQIRKHGISKPAKHKCIMCQKRFAQSFTLIDSN